MDSGTSHQLLLLCENDNVVIALGAIAVGTAITSAGEQIDVKSPVTLGHKIARSDIPVGDPVYKYGVSIGSATKTIHPGQHVHIHNMKSNYTTTYTLQETEKGNADV